jgi:CheY-like chemotaxis protein
LQLQQWSAGSDNVKVPTLLLADESVTIQRVMHLIFADQNVRVVSVGDGDQAIQSLDAAPPDIVLADAGMPGRNGYDVARYVKQSPRLAHIPVVLLTGAFEPVDQVRATEAGCDSILAKPLAPQLVINRVQQLLAGRQPASAAPDDTAAERVETPSTPPAVPRSLRDTAPAVEIEAKADELDEYFDRLGKAFAERLSAAADTAVQSVTPSDGSEQGITDWSAALPASQSSPPAVESAPPSETAAAAQTTERATPSPLAEAFAALFAAEHGTPPIDATPAARGPAIDDIVEQVSRRVLAQLHERVVRETVADLVSDIAERLVREEIERIKASIK